MENQVSTSALSEADSLLTDVKTDAAVHSLLSLSPSLPPQHSFCIHLTSVTMVTDLLLHSNKQF